MSAPAAVRDVETLADRCGGVAVHVSPDDHDAAVALVSHLPQAVSSALAARLLGEGVGRLPVELSGPGLADTTRLAASNSDLWTEILGANAGHLAPHVRALAADLADLAGALDSLVGEGGAGEGGATRSAVEEIRALLRRGNAGRARVPVKRGELEGAFAGVRVELADEPGQLAQLLLAAGAAGVNVEDLRVEHVPGRQRGVIELLVAPGGEVRLRTALGDKGWQVFSST